MKILFRAVSQELCAQRPRRVVGGGKVVEGKDGVAGQLIPVFVHRELAGVAHHAHLAHVA